MIPQVIGLPGKTFDNTTPSVRAAILAQDGCLVFGNSKADRPTPDEVWDDHGTKLDPPITPKDDHVFVTIGRYERESSHEIRRLFLHESFWSFFDSPLDFDLDLMAWKKGTFIHWYTTPENIKALMEAVASVARSKLTQAMATGSDDLIKLSFWLQRAARSDDDIQLAMAGLKQAGDERHELLRMLLTGV